MMEVRLGWGVRRPPRLHNRARPHLQRFDLFGGVRLLRNHGTDKRHAWVAGVQWNFKRVCDLPKCRRRLPWSVT